MNRLYAMLCPPRDHRPPSLVLSSLWTTRRQKWSPSRWKRKGVKIWNKGAKTSLLPDLLPRVDVVFFRSCHSFPDCKPLKPAMIVNEYRF